MEQVKVDFDAYKLQLNNILLWLCAGKFTLLWKNHKNPRNLMHMQNISWIL